MRNKHSWGLHVGLFSVLCLAVVALIAGMPLPLRRFRFRRCCRPTGTRNMASSGEKQFMKLIGYNDLQGRETLQVTTRGDWAYVGHHNRPTTKTGSL